MKKLAEVLIERKQVNDQIQALLDRMQRSSMFPEGDAPDEDVTVLGGMLEEAFIRYAKLDFAISSTNASIYIPGQTFTVLTAINKRDLAKRRQQAYLSIANNLSRAGERHSFFGRRRDESQPKMVKPLSFSTYQTMADVNAKEFRAFDVMIQAANWQIEVDV